jgi:Kef-type K+ transport system membrane component KefB
VAIGILLALAVLEELAVSANSTKPVPPLVLELDWSTLLIALVGFLALTFAAAALLTRTAFRAPAAIRSPETA